MIFERKDKIILAEKIPLIDHGISQKPSGTKFHPPFFGGLPPSNGCVRSHWRLSDILVWSGLEKSSLNGRAFFTVLRKKSEFPKYISQIANHSPTAT